MKRNYILTLVPYKIPRLITELNIENSYVNIPEQIMFFFLILDGKDLRETKTPEMTKDKIDTLGIICSFNEYLLSNHYALLGSVLDTRSQSNTKRRLGTGLCYSHISTI